MGGMITCKICGRKSDNTICLYCGQHYYLFCDSCGEMLEWDPEGEKCPRCGAWFEGSEGKHGKHGKREPIHGKTQICDRCGHIMQAFWRDMVTYCDYCGAGYFNNGSSFVLKEK